MLPSMVRSYHVSTGVGIDGLALRTHEPRTPKEGEVAVAVHAASLSFRELLVLRGEYVLPVKPGVIPVSDGAGRSSPLGRMSGECAQVTASPPHCSRGGWTARWNRHTCRNWVAHSTEC